MKRVKIALGILLFIGTYIILNMYIGWNGLIFLHAVIEGFSAVAYWCCFWLIALAYIFGRIPFIPGVVRRLLKVIGAYYLAIFQFSLLLLPPVNIAVWLLDLFYYASADVVPIAGMVVVAAIIILIARGSWNAWRPVVRKYELELAKQAGGLPSLHIAAISDLHLGNTVGNRHLKRLLAKLNQLQPDLILMPGDVIDDDIEPFIRNRMSDLLSQMKARYGVYAVLGNHEYYGGHKTEYIKQMHSIGIQVLEDEVVLVDGRFYIVGRKDKTAESMEREGRKQMEELLANVDKTLPVIVMDHQPTELAKIAEAGGDLLLSGHTHRGQISPNHFITRKLFEVDWGYALKNKMHVIVSSGFGAWGPPIRLGSRAEIVGIQLQFINEKTKK